MGRPGTWVTDYHTHTHTHTHYCHYPCYTGQDAQQSRDNLENWLDGIVNSYATPNSLVFALDHTKLSGLYHKLKLNEYLNIVGQVSSYNQWTSECVANNLSAGKWISIAGAEVGTTELIQCKIGPFKG